MLLCCLVLAMSRYTLLAETSNSGENFIINKTREISQNIKCLVCQNQSIDESNSEIAKDLKVLIKNKLKDGVSDDEIYNFLRDRYGDYENIFYCGAGAYPCGSVAGTTGYMCAKQLKRLIDSN